ncbi:MAG: HEAT repeat domain-containing protein [Acidobacteria bacterium]|nr:HEAT repeat domain-containing protein [Acidobacteriota bacterium]
MTPDRLAELMARLADLEEGEHAFIEVVRAGEDAIPGLRDMVMSHPQPVFAHRCLAVDALAAIGTPGARSVLVLALEELATRDVPASLQLAEDAVVNRIAGRLSRLGPDDHVTDALLAALAARPRREVARALGRLGDLRAIPLLIGCLDDDVARDGAGEALRRLGPGAVEALAEKLRTPAGSGGYEASHLVAGRAAAANILGAIATPGAKKTLAGALDDPQPPVRSAAAVALVEAGGPLREQAIPVLIETLDREGWLDTVPARDTLVALGPHAVPHLIDALELPRSGEAGERRCERVLEILARLSPREAVPAIARLARGTARSGVGLAAVSALESIAGPQATRAIGGFLDHRSPAVRERAVRALGRRGRAGAVSMVRALGDESRGVRRAAWEAFSSMEAGLRAAFRRTVLADGSLRQRLGVLLRSIRAHTGRPGPAA